MLRSLYLKNKKVPRFLIIPQKEEISGFIENSSGMPAQNRREDHG